MSLELALAENTTALTAMVEVLKQIDQNQQRLLVVADKAEPAKPARATRKKADEEKPQPAAETPAAEPASENPKVVAPTLTADEVKNNAVSWMNEKAKGSPERDERGNFLLDLQKHIGRKLGELEDADDLKQAHFFVERKKAGHDVNFSADYDFDGAIDQDTGAASASDDDFG